MKRSRPAPRPKLPDVPAPDPSADDGSAACIEESMFGLDDAQLMECLGYPACEPHARRELERRAQKDVQASGLWRSGPDAPVPYPPAGYERFRNGIRPGAPSTSSFPKSVKTPEDRDTFTRMLFLAENGHEQDRYQAILTLQNRFGYNWHKEARRQ